MRTGSRLIEVELVPASRAGEPGYRDRLCEVDRWLRARIAAPDPKLGRPGDVCPFVGGALARDSVRYALVSGADLAALQITSVVGSLGIEFDRIRAASARPDLETVVIVFPDLDPDRLAAVVFEVHQVLKDSFVRAQRMLGEFVPGYDAPGIHNPEFRPLCSPVPLLVIRSMVGNDSLFLRDSVEWLCEHARWRAGDRKQGSGHGR